MMRLVLLAAGKGARFGENKLLHPLDGKPLFLHALDLLTSVPGAEVAVVTRYPEIEQAALERGARVLWNPDAEQGISTSVRLGLSGAGDAPCAFFVADQPFLRMETVRDFLRGWEASGKGLGCVRHGEESGNPCVFAPKYREELRALEGDRGGKRVLNAHPEDVYYHEVADARELWDIDKKGDLKGAGA